MKFANSTLLLSLLLLSTLVVGILPVQGQEEATTHTIIVHNSFFEPDYLEVEIGDIIIFEWAEDADFHNVVQVKGDSALNALDDGFNSGDPTGAPHSFEIPAEYLDSDVTLYYVCEPHASSGMRGEIVVGAGSTETGSANTMGLLMVLLTPVMISILRKNK